MRVVCDSSSLISLSGTCTLGALAFAREKLGAEFVIPPAVEREIISRPKNVHEYAFSAVRLEKQVADGVLAVASDATLERETSAILVEANSLLVAGGRPLEILHAGEAECLALLALNREPSAFLVDEKTARLLVENPARLLESVHGEFAGGVSLNERAAAALSRRFRNAPVIRSSELLALCAEKGYFANFANAERDAFHAAIYAVRRAGCGLTQNELEEYEKLAANART